MAAKSIRARLRSDRAAAVALGLAMLAASGGAAAKTDACATARAPRFALKFGDEVSPLPLIATSVMPGAPLEIEAVLTEKPARFDATADEGRIERLREDRWRWQAPSVPGAHRITVHDAVSDTTACLRVFVLRPYAGDETLDGYEIGAYPPGTAPPGLIRVDADMVDLPVSPHFRVAPFLAKQEGGFPKYIALRTRLLLALEAIASALHEKGRDGLTVMSGYRTPYYNARLGNETTKSRHLFGEAADVYVDQDGDGRMDDLDGDGAVTDADARVLYGWIEEMSAEPWFKPFIGGLAAYPATAFHGPFVHVDVRGQSVRW